MTTTMTARQCAPQPGPNVSKDEGTTPAGVAGADSLEALVSGVTEYAIFMLDPEGRVTHWNRGAEHIKGYRAEEIIGEHFSIFYTEEDRAANLPAQALETAMRKGIYEAQAWRIRKGGGRFMASVVVQPIHDSAGRLIGYAKLTRDVSERFRQQQAVQEARGALARGRRSLAQRPLRRIAHDLNNVLQSIRNGAELLSLSRTGDPHSGRLVDMLKRNTEQATDLTSQLLSLAREEGDTAVHIEVNRLLAGTLDQVRHMLGDTVPIETRLGDDLWSVKADPDQLKVTILNLIANARNALSRGGALTVETGNVVFETAAPALFGRIDSGEYVMIAVGDAGTGMTGELAAKAFDVSAAGVPEDGAGLGISQVHAFARHSEGHIGLETAPHLGTTMRLYLPRAQDAAPDTAAAGGTSSAAEKDRKPNLAGLRVLVVEDESLVAILVEDLLEQLGCVVTDLVSDLSAIGDALDGDLDLALLDVNIGDRTVYGLADTLYSRGIPFVFMSGNDELEERWRGIPAVQKPFALEQLKGALEQAASGRNG